MAITNLLIKLKPEEVPDFMKGRFFELYINNGSSAVLGYDDVTAEKLTYAGWVELREDGTIEFGEPGV